MDSLSLVTLDEESLYDHIFERYIDLSSNTDSLKQDLGVYERSNLLQLHIEPFTNQSESVDTNDGSESMRKKKRKKKLDSNDDFYILELEQSISSLTSSNNNNSTTGYLLWSTTPFFLKWLLYHPSARPFRIGEMVGYANDSGQMYVPPLINKEGKNVSIGVIELGSGVSGVLPVVIGNFVDSYCSTDQIGILPKLKHNIKENLINLNKRFVISNTLSINNASIEDSAKKFVNLECVPLDWERFELQKSTLDPILSNLSKMDIIYIVAMDVIYNEFLIPPFLNTLMQLRDHYRSLQMTCHCLIGIHLRSQSILEEFLEQAIIEHQLPVKHIQTSYLETSRFSFYLI